MTLSKVYKYSLFLFLFFVPFVDVYSFSEWFPIPFVLTLIIFLIGFLFSRKIIFIKQDIILYLIILLMIIPIYFGLYYSSIKLLNHILGFTIPVFFYYLVVRNAIFHTLKAYNDYINFYKILSLSMLSVSFFIIFEFLARNYLNINIDNFVYHMGRESYIAETAGKIIRARGFATESGLMSIYYEFCIFLSYIYIRQKSQLVGIIFYIINLFAFTLLFSSAAFFCLGVSLLIFFILNLKSFLQLLYTLFFPLLIFIFLSYDFISQFIVQVFLNKITLLNGNILSGSSLERYSVYNLIYNIITEFPFGIGLGISQSVVYLGETYLGYEVSAGQLSLYGTLLISGGFISLILFIFFIFNKLYTLKRSNNKILFILAASSIFIHYSIVGDYWLPFLWVYLACLDFEIFRKEKLI